MSIKRMTPAGRRAAIRDRLLVDGSLSVDYLAADLGVSVATIRRDLTALEDTGFVQRTHGGAMAGTPRGADQAFALREQTDRAAKRHIARTAIGLIQAERTLLLNDGSTILAMARELAVLGLPLTVATCGVNVATTLSENPGIQTYLTGGVVRHRTLATTGRFVDHMLSFINADIAFVAAESMSAEHGITFSYEEDAVIARKMSERAEKTVVLSTARKLTLRDRFIALGPDQIDLLITDCDAPAIIRPFQDAGIEVLIAAPGAIGAANVRQFTAR